MEETNLEPQEFKPLSFRDFLNESTNLLTIFGIFNALAIWGSEIPDKENQLWISLTFTLLSILTLWEVIAFLLEKTNESYKFQIFTYLICTAQLGMIIFVFNNYKEVLIGVAIMAVFFAQLIGIFILITKPATNLVYYIYSKSVQDKVKRERKVKRAMQFVAILFIITDGILILTITHFIKIYLGLKPNEPILPFLLPQYFL